MATRNKDIPKKGQMNKDTPKKKDHKTDNIDQTKNKLICLSLDADTLTTTLSEF